MEEKKILFKYENGLMSSDIKNVTDDELLVFICEMLEDLIANKVVTRDLMLTYINMYLAVETLDIDNIEDKELAGLIDELTNSMLLLFNIIDEDKNNK